MEKQNVESFLEAKIEKARKAYGTANGEGVMALIHQGEALAEMLDGFEGTGRGNKGFNHACENDPALPPKTTAYKLIDIYNSREKVSPVGESLPNSMSTIHAMLKYSKEEIEHKFASGEWDNKATRDKVQGITRKETRANAANDSKATEPEASPTKTEASWDDLLSAVNITTETVEQASQDMMHPQYMVARRLSESKDRIVKAMTPLSKPERKKSMSAVVEVLVYEQEVFQAEVKALMPKYNKELEVRLKREIDEQKKVTAEVRKKIGAGFDKKDFKVIRGALHPDRDVSQERRSQAFDLLLKLEPLFS